MFHLPSTINPLTINACISTHFLEKETTGSSLPRTKQPDKFPSTVFESNEYGQSFPVFVGLRQPGC